MAVEECTTGRITLIVRVWHLLYEEIEQQIFALIGELAIGIAPFAVVLVERAVGFVTDERIVGERHTATLANQCLRRTQERVDRHVELL